MKTTTRVGTTNETAGTEVTIRKNSLPPINFLFAILLVSAISWGISFAVENVIAKQKDAQAENQQQAEQITSQHQAEQMASQLEINYTEYSDIRRKIGNDEKRELQRMLREMSYTDVIPSTGYRKFDRFTCKLYIYESEKGNVEILVNPKREALIQLCTDDDMQIVDIIDNIDYTIGRDLPEVSIIFHNATWIADENGMNKWEFGKKILIVEESFKEYENTELSIVRDKIIMYSGRRILEIDEETYNELITDCQNAQYKFFCNSLFYINPKCDLLEYNLLTGEKTKIDSEVYMIRGEIRVRYKIINVFADQFIPGYIDNEGKRRRFADFEIDEELIMTVVNQ